MSQSVVDDILKMIDGLSDAERAVLEQQLSERAEAEWRSESEAARRVAEERGIDQAAIDEAIRTNRYGR